MRPHGTDAPPAPRLELAGRTDAGPMRALNEDAFALRPECGLALCIDGLGGAAAGAFAAGLAIETILACYAAAHARPGARPPGAQADPERGDAEGLMVAALQHANAALLAAAGTDVRYLGGGASVAALVPAEGETVCLAHAGDVRAYRARARRPLEPMTEDHSLANELRRARPAGVTNAQLEELAATHPTVITRSVGMAPKLTVDTRLERVVVGDVFLLCTDGLWRTLSDAELGAALDATLPDVSRAAARLVELGLERQASDNLTAVLARVAAVG